MKNNPQVLKSLNESGAQQADFELNSQNNEQHYQEQPKISPAKEQVKGFNPKVMVRKNDLKPLIVPSKQSQLVANHLKQITFQDSKDDLKISYYSSNENMFCEPVSVMTGSTAADYSSIILTPVTFDQDMELDNDEIYKAYI